MWVTSLRQSERSEPKGKTMTVFFEEQRSRFRTEQNNSTFRTQSRACSFFRGSWLQSIVRVSIVTVPAPFCTSISDWTLLLHSRGRDCHTHCLWDCHTQFAGLTYSLFVGLPHSLFEGLPHSLHALYFRSQSYALCKYGWIFQWTFP